LSLRVFGTPTLAPFIRTAFVAMTFSNLVEIGLLHQRIQQRAGFVVTCSLLILATNLSLNVYFIAFAKLGIWGFMFGKLIATGIGALLLVALVFRDVGWRPSWDLARRMATFGWPLAATSSSIFVIHFSDRFFLMSYSGLTAVGIYAMAYKFAFLVAYL